MSLFLVLLCLLFFGAVLLLVTLNNAPVDVNLLFRSYHQVSLSLVIVFSVLAGIGFASILGVLDGVRLRMQNRRLRRLLARLGLSVDTPRTHTPSLPESRPTVESPLDRPDGD